LKFRRAAVVTALESTGFPEQDDAESWYQLANAAEFSIHG